MTYRPYAAIIAEASSQNSKVRAEYKNQSGFTIPAFNVVGLDANGYISSIDVSDEQTSLTAMGIAEAAIPDNTEGMIVFSGRIENVSLPFAFGKFLYVAKDGSLTDSAPTIGVNGFVAGDAVIRAGSIVRNRTNPTNKDLIVKIVIEGKL